MTRHRILTKRRKPGVGRAYQCINHRLHLFAHDHFEKNNSFLVHVADICDWPIDSLSSVYGPLKRPGFDDDLAIMTPMQPRGRLRAVLALLPRAPSRVLLVGRGG